MRIIIHLDLWWISKPAVFVHRVPHLLFIGPNCLGRTLLFVQLDRRAARIVSETKQFPLKKKYHGSLTWWKIRNHLLQIWIIDIKCISYKFIISFSLLQFLEVAPWPNNPPRKEIPKSQLHPLAPSLSPWKCRKRRRLTTHRVRSSPCFSSGWGIFGNTIASPFQLTAKRPFPAKW